MERVHLYCTCRSIPVSMPLTNEQMKGVVDTLEHVDAPKRRSAFNAMRGLLRLAHSEEEDEYGRVEAALRYLAQVKRDTAVLRRVHMHAVPCAVQVKLRGL